MARFAAAMISLGVYHSLSPELWPTWAPLIVSTRAARATTFSSGRSAIFCARLEIFLSMPRSRRVGGSFTRFRCGTGSPPLFLSVAFSISPSLRRA